MELRLCEALKKLLLKEGCRCQILEEVGDDGTSDCGVYCEKNSDWEQALLGIQARAAELKRESDMLREKLRSLRWEDSPEGRYWAAVEQRQDAGLSGVEARRKVAETHPLLVPTELRKPTQKNSAHYLNEWHAAGLDLQERENLAPREARLRLSGKCPGLRAAALGETAQTRVVGVVEWETARGKTLLDALALVQQFLPGDYEELGGKPQ